MYYSGSITALRAAIEKKAPETKANFRNLVPNEIPPFSYLLWMCDEVERMDISSIDDAVKAARWMGWVFAHAELSGIWDNSQTRDLVREDHRRGLDKPHLT